MIDMGIHASLATTSSGDRFALINGRIVLPKALAPGHALLVEGRHIAGVVPMSDLGRDIACLDVGGRLIAPGLIDIHIHGAQGHTFNEATPEAFATVASENARRGVTSLLATTATDTIDNLEAVLKLARAWMAETPPGAQVLGVHVEGPYFNQTQRGAQDPAHIRNPDDGTAQRLLAHHDVIRIFTFAPELPGALELTRRVADLGIVPAAGHSAAREEDVAPAINAGLRHMIHMWSAQSTTIREGPWRKPGLLEVSLTDERLTGEIIADGKHLPPTLMKLAYKCLGPDRLCAISDATSGAGLPEGARFRMGGMEYEVCDGVGMLFDRTAFAGSTTLLNQMIPILVEQAGVPLVEAIRMASLTPARVIGMDGCKGSLEAGKDADVAVFNDDFTAWCVLIGGRCTVYDSTAPAGSFVSPPSRIPERPTP
jgi:N-acetylglucosamine-6-phosphate deacetylase